MRPSFPTHITREGSSFESTETFLKKSVVVDASDDVLDEAGVPLTWISGTKYATSPTELHTFIIGESGCGKTRKAIMPTIRLISKTGNSMVVSDPKGELYQTTSEALRAKGYDVKIINFKDPRRGNCWNPLSMIENQYRSGDKELQGKATHQLGELAESLAETVESSDDRYWETVAKDTFGGIARLLLEFGNPGSLTLDNISLIAAEINAGVYEKRVGLEKTWQNEEWKGFYEKLPSESLVKRGLSSFVEAPESTRQCIYAVLRGMLSYYVNQESLNVMLSASDFDFRQIGTKPTVLFIVLPDYEESLYPIATILVSQIYQTLVRLADDEGGKLPNPVTFILDEFANFAPIPGISSMLTAARSRRIRFVLVCQSIEQLSLKYKSELMVEILLSNCRVWIFMSCRNISFLERLEKLCGEYRSPYTKETVPLISVSDMQHFEMGEVLVINDRCSPIIGKLKDYDKYENFGEGPTEVVDFPAENESQTRVVCTLELLMENSKRRKPEITVQTRLVTCDGVAHEQVDGDDPLRRALDAARARTAAKLAELEERSEPSSGE